MPIRIQLLLFGILGNILIASVFLFSSIYREDIQETSAGDFDITKLRYHKLINLIISLLNYDIMDEQ